MQAKMRVVSHQLLILLPLASSQQRAERAEERKKKQIELLSAVYDAFVCVEQEGGAPWHHQFTKTNFKKLFFLFTPIPISLSPSITLIACFLENNW